MRVDRLPKDISHPLKANLTTRPGFAARSKAVLEDSNLVDPASSHMLVSKTKPCMSKYKSYTRNCEWLIKTVIVYLIIKFTWITVVILELIHAIKPDLWKGCIY